MQHDHRDIHAETTGRWASLLPALGIDQKYLRNKQGPCPICGGATRFRFDDKEGRGTWICNHCGAGNGVDLVMSVLRIDFKAASAAIRECLPRSVVVPPKKERRVDPGIYKNLWLSAQPLDGTDPASLYLKRRGYEADQQWPKALRYVPRMTYRHDDGQREEMPALLAIFVAPDMSSQTWEVQYLTPSGAKADVPRDRKFAPLPVPAGGAVRLAPSAQTMGVAEGVATGLSAMVMHGVPVWATLSANNLMKFEPPPTVKHLIVFGDPDRSFSGQHAAYSLAYRLTCEAQRSKRNLEVSVRIPDEMGSDWNDLHMAGVAPEMCGGSVWA